MTISKEHIKIGLLAFIVIIGVIFIYTLFRGKKEEPTGYKEALKAQDQALAAKDSQISTLNEFKDYLKDDREQHYRNDSLFAAAIIKNQSNYRVIDKKINETITSINNLSKDSIRQLFSN